MVRSVTLEIPGEPMGEPRKRVTNVDGAGRPLRFPRHYDAPKAARQKAVIGQYALKAMNDAGLSLFTGPVGVLIEVVLACPRSRWRKKAPVGRKRSTSKPDYDNVEKMLLDACEGIVYANDSQCFGEGCGKWIGAQGERPYLRVRFTEYPEGE